MGRIKFVEHDGKRILMLDFSEIERPRDAMAAIAHAREFVATHHVGPRSLLTLTNVRHSAATQDVGLALVHLARHNKPYVRAAAVVGVGAAQRELFQLVMTVSERGFEEFDDVERAKEWLAQQA
ncbi:MAG: hypothetical protein HYR48_02025 [Gemmatimonadetes bacterium]|nr:hypothetical protein [Gemmatimonadota bacterium]